jgi:hypothetical protein
MVDNLELEFPVYGLTANHGSAQAVAVGGRLALVLFTTRAAAARCRLSLYCFGPLIEFEDAGQLLMYLYAIPPVINDHLFDCLVLDYSGVDGDGGMAYNIPEVKAKMAAAMGEAGETIARMGDSIASARIVRAMRQAPALRPD